jgi:hypothetical protein
MRPSDLRGEAADAFRMWHDFFGLSEESAMNALAQDGLVPTNGSDRTVNVFRGTFGLSEEGARIAAAGRDGRSARSVSEVAGGSAARPEPGDALRLVGKIEGLAANLCRRGVSEEKALREAAFAVFEAAPDDLTQEWVARVVEHRWPALWTGSGSSGFSRASGTVRG